MRNAEIVAEHGEKIRGICGCGALRRSFRFRPGSAKAQPFYNISVTLLKICCKICDKFVENFAEKPFLLLTNETAKVKKIRIAQYEKTALWDDPRGGFY